VLDLKGGLMAIVEIVLLAIGLAMLVFGYKKNDRNVLVGAALVLLLSAALGDMVHGFVEGMTGVRSDQTK
jgi:putative copper export protein